MQSQENMTFQKLSLLLSTALLFGLLSFSAMSQDMASMLGNLQVDKGQMMNMINAMEQAGTITKDQAAQARAELKNKSDKDIKMIQQRAMQEIQSGNIDKYKKLMPSQPASAGVNPTQTDAKEEPIAAASSDSSSTASGPEATVASAKTEESTETKTDAEGQKLQNALQFLNSGKN